MLKLYHGIIFGLSLAGWQKTELRGSAADRKRAIVARSMTLPYKNIWNEISEKVRESQFE